MNWYRLAELPGQRVVNPEFPEIVYWEIRDGSVWHQGRKLRRANATEFEVRKDDHVFIARDDRWVFHAWSQLKNVDRDSFEVVGDGYCRDKNLAYCEFETSLRPLKGRDRAHFVVLGNGYARDSVHAYYWGKPIRSCASPLTLALPEGVRALPYALDDEQVFFESAALRGADRDKWRMLDDMFSGDDTKVYYGAKKLPGVERRSWERVRQESELYIGSYSRDAKSVYVMFFRLRGADPATWRKLTGNYSTDGTQVYFVNRTLDGADAESFEVTSNEGDLQQTARDKRGSFRGGERERQQ